MADSNTPNLALVQPEVGASTDTWGNKLNADLGSIDSLFNPLPALLVAKGGTGATDPATARTNLGCGSMAVQDATAVAITGGSLDAVYLGTTTPCATVNTQQVQVHNFIQFGDLTQQFSAAVTYSVGFAAAYAGVTSLTPTYQEHNIEAVATAGAVTVTLFTAIGNSGRKVQVKKTDGTANLVTINSAGGLIDGAATAVIYHQFDAYTLISDGVNWQAF